MKRNISCHMVRQTTLLSSLQQLLEMSVFCPYISSKTLKPLVNCNVNDSLVHAVPNVQQTIDWIEIYPPSVNSAFCFIARLRIRSSTNRTQLNFANQWEVNRANKLP